MLVGVSQGPRMQWDKTYYVVPLGAMFGGKRVPKAKSRRITDAMFPSEVRFPAKESLGEGNLLRDAAMTSPFVQEDGGKWGLVIGEFGPDDEDLAYDGWLGENAPLIVECSVGQGMMAGRTSAWGRERGRRGVRREAWRRRGHRSCRAGAPTRQA